MIYSYRNIQNLLKSGEIIPWRKAISVYKTISGNTSTLNHKVITLYQPVENLNGYSDIAFVYSFVRNYNNKYVLNVIKIDTTRQKILNHKESPETFTLSEVAEFVCSMVLSESWKYFKDAVWSGVFGDGNKKFFNSEDEDISLSKNHTEFNLYALERITAFYKANDEWYHKKFGNSLEGNKAYPFKIIVADYLPDDADLTSRQTTIIPVTKRGRKPKSESLAGRKTYIPKKNSMRYIENSVRRMF